MSDGSDHPWYWLVLGVLAVWRVTHLLHVEHGPWGVLAALRDVAAGAGAGELFDCFFCLTLWTAIPAALWIATTWTDRILVWLALSAGAILVETRPLGGTDPERP